MKTMWLRFALLIAFVFASPFSSAGQSHCQPEETIAFTCKIQKTKKFISICTSSPLSEDKGYIQYRFGAIGHIELKYPPVLDSSSINKFKWTWLHPYSGFYEELAFNLGSYEYAVFKSDNGSNVTKSGLNEIEAGIRVANTGTKKEFKLICESDPVGNFDFNGIIKNQAE